MVCSLVSKYFNRPQLGIQLKQAITNLRILIQRYAQFSFSEKCLGLISQFIYFVYDYSRKAFLMVHSIN